MIFYKEARALYTFLLTNMLYIHYCVCVCVAFPIKCALQKQYVKCHKTK